VCIIFILLLVFPRESRSASDESATGVGNAQKDQETLEKFGQKAPGKIDELDSKLTEALILYYDGKYGQALPIFNEIASEVETTDIMWWIGTSAMNTGDLNLAVRKYQQMLAVDPKLYRVRLELATAYFQFGRYRESQAGAGDGEGIQSSRRSQGQYRSFAGSHRGCRTEADMEYPLFPGHFMGYQCQRRTGQPDYQRRWRSTFTLNPSAAKVGDTGYATNLSANVLYKFSEQQGLMWNTSLDYYNLLYNQYAQYDYSMIDMATGPWWVGGTLFSRSPSAI